MWVEGAGVAGCREGAERERGMEEREQAVRDISSTTPPASPSAKSSRWAGPDAGSATSAAAARASSASDAAVARYRLAEPRAQFVESGANRSADCTSRSSRATFSGQRERRATRAVSFSALLESPEAAAASGLSRRRREAKATGCMARAMAASTAGAEGGWTEKGGRCGWRARAETAAERRKAQSDASAAKGDDGGVGRTSRVAVVGEWWATASDAWTDEPDGAGAGDWRPDCGSEASAFISPYRS
jgi:hypothetical protein